MVNDITKPLKELDVAKAFEKDKEGNLLIHHEKRTAIIIPKDVLEVLNKVNSSIIQADILAHALQLRSKGNDSDVIVNWIELGHVGSHYPLTHANEVFSKFLRSTLSAADNQNLLTEKEVRTLVHFFAKCPHGYTIPKGLIRAHSELQALHT